MLGLPGFIEWVIILFILGPLLIIPVVLFWLILGKAGLPEPLALIALFPGLGELALLFVLAFARWPAVEGGERAETPR
jgi:hypothetical protein